MVDKGIAEPAAQFVVEVAEAREVFLEQEIVANQFVVVAAAGQGCTTEGGCFGPDGTDGERIEYGGMEGASLQPGQLYVRVADSVVPVRRGGIAACL